MQIKNQKTEILTFRNANTKSKKIRGLSENVLGSYEKQVQVLVAAFGGLDACAEKVV